MKVEGERTANEGDVCVDSHAVISMGGGGREMERERKEESY